MSLPEPARRRLHLRLKIILAMGVVAILCVAAILIPDHRARRRQILEDFQIFVRSVAGPTVIALRGEDIVRIRTNADAQSRDTAAQVDAAQRTLTATEPMHFKNVQAHVTTYRRSAAPEKLTDLQPQPRR